ncbi:hypothetical protein NL676_019354 [Syzygium grande]|nr:hypothetical protein NL676_019354 [Syzygium grande]
MTIIEISFDQSTSSSSIIVHDQNYCLILAPTPCVAKCPWEAILMDPFPKRDARLLVSKLGPARQVRTGSGGLANRATVTVSFWLPPLLLSRQIPKPPPRRRQKP